MIRRKIQRAFQLIRSYFPSALPQGSEEFDAYASKLLELYSLPQKDTYRHAIASMIMHLGPTTHRIPMRYFAISIFKAMSNEVAYSKIQDLKKALAAEEQKRKTEDSPQLTAKQGISIEREHEEPVPIQGI